MDDELRRDRAGQSATAGAGRTYVALALIAVNTLLVLAVLNGAAAAWLALRQRYWPPPPGALAYGLERLLPLYPGMSEQEVVELLTESWSRGHVYAPLVEHREDVFAGRFVNVEPAGFRRSVDQRPWPPDDADLAVFVYGGSTTFGYGLPDDQTIPSYMQLELGTMGCGRPVAVYNFGRGNYYSDQERALFAGHLATGLEPDVAVFIDGLNEWKPTPKFTGRLAYLMAETPGELRLRALKSLALVELLRLVRGPRNAEAGADLEAAAAGERWLERWLRNKRLIAAAGRELGVPTLFVWQPAPTYQFEMASHPLADQVEPLFDTARHRAARHAYARLDRMRASDPELEAASDVLWLADMQRGRDDPLYVDAVHYSARFSRDIAARVAAAAAARLGCAAGRASASGGGERR